MKMYKQCTLVQGPTTTVGWIEERGAKLNANVEVPELGGLWTVTGVGDISLTSTQVDLMGRAKFPSINPV